jgi:hypothetical protein
MTDNQREFRFGVGARNVSSIATRVYNTAASIGPISSVAKGAPATPAGARSSVLLFHSGDIVKSIGTFFKWA